ncbi:MAG: TIGR04282 family arsenosugar biosynthesis glycosyltransferase [Sandaracinus sp.]|nr:TIGR04282 family arsenosugar biosynthesis glycosyltransferase [Sandaracinus sp.]MCB9621107.1 TIGR04282 family arsenosugar biosynthesis glycosyltransferase [Sandaracinus sp.]MCB9622578.1 TIGR04282 family arsenosugar biosynthesis glycosyltransferase [Sandaracinus sp.]MCB9635631.1 TIGR04282 family arsenosugar biosynthesis glycosyltransferase [Sandaracinus sp.]
MKATRVALFGKPPVAGHVKTRLGATLGAERAASLYRAFLLDAVTNAQALPGPLTLWVDGDPNHPTLDAVDVPIRAQVGDDLGERMRRCFEVELAHGLPVLLVGTDVPTLPRRVLVAAREALERHDVVFVPSADGGYVLVGARVVPCFDSVRWSTSHALADTLEHHPDAVVLEPWYDVDDADDLRLLRLELLLRPEAAPRTAAWLAHSP